MARSLLILVCFALFAGAGCKDDPVPPFRKISIEPREGPDDQPTDVTLRGDFVFARLEVDLGDPSQSKVARSMTADLGTFALADLRFVSRGVVASSVPGQEMMPGDYDLTITDAEGRIAKLPAAFRILRTVKCPEGTGSGGDSGDCTNEEPPDAGADAMVPVEPPDAMQDEPGDAMILDAREPPDAMDAAVIPPDAMPDPNCPSTCGDGVIDPGEACDDGNLVDGDGCDHCCRIEPGYLCMRAPSVCVRQDQTTWVSSLNHNCPGHGTMADPFCRIQNGVNHIHPNVVILHGPYPESVLVRQRRLLLAEIGADLSGGQPDALRIRGGVEVRVVGLQIGGDADAVVVADPRTRAVIEQCEIGPSNGVGIAVYPGASLTLDRTLIRANPGGGVIFNGLHYRLTSDVIVENGTDGSHYGGVALITTSTASIFVNNTLASNQALDTPGSVLCLAPARLVNSIIWSVSSNAAGINTLCLPRYSDFRLMVAGTGNFSAEPMFLERDHFHIATTSPCVNAGDPAGVMPQGPAPPRDFDGRLRPRGPRVDVGAHEAR